ncbi:MAG: hypothetical protein HDR04_09185 [Lachnospiraceae bacterium]|nr:hypothetical protein [Lachnospiraceae bacterium]
MSDTEMIMGDAGKAMLVPRGQYSDTETYEYLDFVYSGDASYVAKKLTTGNPPAEDNEYWQLLARGGTLTENSDVSNTTVTFKEAEQRINIFSKDSLSVIAGKIKKWFADLKTVAFSGKYSDLEGRLTVTNNDLANMPGTAWDAVRGAAIRKDVDKINSDLDGINPSKANYVTYENINKISDINFVRQHPVIFTGGVPYMPNIGTFYNILTMISKSYDAASQIAIGELGIAIRYHSHDTNKWSAWTKL